MMARRNASTRVVDITVVREMLPSNTERRMGMNKRILTALTLGTVILGVPTFAANPEGDLFKSKCAMCHAANGSGDTPMGKSQKLRDLRSDEVQKQTDIELTKVISGGKGKMPAYGKQLSTAQIEGLIAFIRTLKK
jgi:cytochrome c6